MNVISIHPAEIVFSKPFSLTNKKITNLLTPTDMTDAATRQYVDTRCVKNNAAYKPILENNNGLTGFIASCSNQMGPGFQAHGAFNNLKPDWATLNATGWLTIQCPDPVSIWKVALNARSVAGKNITSWSISASNDALTFQSLLTSTSALLEAATKQSFFEINTPASYQYYKFTIITSEGTPGIGIQYMQVYTVDALL